MEPVVMALKAEYGREIIFIVADVTEEEGEKLAAKFQTQYIPAFFYVDRSGNIAGQDSGYLTESYLASRIEELLLPYLGY